MDQRMIAFFNHELLMTKAEQKERRLAILAVILLAFFILTNAYHIVLFLHTIG